jgi:hypothetical protein
VRTGKKASLTWLSIDAERSLSSHIAADVSEDEEEDK